MGVVFSRQMVVVETVLTGLVDEFPKLGLNTCARVLTATAVAILFFFLGLPMVTQVLPPLPPLKLNMLHPQHTHPYTRNALWVLIQNTNTL